MKNPIQTIFGGAILLTCMASFSNAASVPVFDSCNVPQKYLGQSWYPDLAKKMNNLGVRMYYDVYSSENGVSVSEMCYSKSRNQVIVNVPYMEVSDKSKKCGEDLHTCNATLNIFSYNIKNKTLTRATRDSTSIYEGLSKQEFLNKYKLFDYGTYIDQEMGGNREVFYDASIWNSVTEFGKRVGDYIELSAGYGDAGISITHSFKYFYNTNIIKAISTIEDSGDLQTGEKSVIKKSYGN